MNPQTKKLIKQYAEATARAVDAILAANHNGDARAAKNDPEFRKAYAEAKKAEQLADKAARGTLTEADLSTVTNVAPTTKAADQLDAYVATFGRGPEATTKALRTPQGRMLYAAARAEGSA